MSVDLDGRSRADYTYQRPQAIEKIDPVVQSPEKLTTEFQTTAAEFRAELQQLRQEVDRNASEDTLVRLADQFRNRWGGVFRDKKWQQVEGIGKQLQEIQTTLQDINADWVRGELKSRAQRLAQMRGL